MVLPWLATPRVWSSTGDSPVDAPSDAPSGAASYATPDFAFVDDRFAAARAFARKSRLAAAWTAVDGDVMAPWHSLLRPALARGSVSAVGITTESFRFCLEVLAREHGSTTMTRKRHGADLIAWQLEVRPHG
jgi:hypothetical protein